MSTALPREFGRYVLEKRLAESERGAVFLARSDLGGERVVIKTIAPKLSSDPRFGRAFAHEAVVLGRIDHPGVARMLNAGRVGSEYFMAIEHVDGHDLGEALDRGYARGERMPEALALFVAAEILDALDHLHRAHRLVHREITPSNVMLGFDGAVKLIDFGWTRPDLLPEDARLHLVVASYGYMPPEVARLDPIDGRADLFSVGAVLFELVTGERLVDEEDRATLLARVLNPVHRRPSTARPGLRPEIDRLIMTALAPKEADRFQSAAEMRTFIDQISPRHASKDDLAHYVDRICRVAR